MGGFSTVSGVAPHLHTQDPRQGGELRGDVTVVDGKTLKDLLYSVVVALS